MEEVLSRLVSELPIMHLLLVTAIVYLWRELNRSRERHIQSLQECIDFKEKTIKDYGELTNVLKEHTTALVELAKGTQK